MCIVQYFSTLSFTIFFNSSVGSQSICSAPDSMSGNFTVQTLLFRSPSFESTLVANLAGSEEHKNLNKWGGLMRGLEQAWILDPRIPTFCMSEKYMWHVTCDTWHVTCDIWHVASDTWHMTGGGRWTFSQDFSALALTVWEWRCF